MDETWRMVDESSGGGPGVGALVAAGRGVGFDAADLGVIADGELPEAVSAGPLPRRWTTGVGLGAATVAGSLVAGLLGPVAIFVCALVISLPAWIAIWWFARRA